MNNTVTTTQQTGKFNRFGYINKTMDREDLFQDDADQIVDELNQLIVQMYSKKAYMTSWFGTLPNTVSNITGVRSFLKYVLQPFRDSCIGRSQRGETYEALSEAADDDRLPWYLYWEIVHVMLNGPSLGSGLKVLDAGGTASLFTSYLASKGVDVHSIDLNPRLVRQGRDIAERMKFSMQSYEMNMASLEFEDESFDHAYSICVFEHLEKDLRIQAIREIARVLKPGGILSVTFDYKNPSHFLATVGSSSEREHLFLTEQDLKESFLTTGRIQLLGNQEFYDNQKTYLVNPEAGGRKYTFGAMFFKKVQ